MLRFLPVSLSPYSFISYPVKFMKLDRIRNEEAAKLEEISIYGHVMRREEQYVGREPPKMEVQ